MAVSQEALAGVFEPGRPFDQSGAREALGKPFGVESPSDVVLSGPLAVARTPAQGPVSRGTARTLCVLVGRIYNLEEVTAASDLESEDAVETLLASAFERHGDAFLAGVSGSFVLVLWDTLRKRGVVAQDQLGVRTLYYCVRGSRLHFASDIGVLTRTLPGRPPPCAGTVVRLLFNAPPLPELTHYEGIKRAAAGHLIELGVDRWQRRRYWEPRYRPPAQRTATELAEELWTTVRCAVRARMEDNGKAGIIMSGGLDSAVVAAAAAAERVGHTSPRSYSAVFPDQPAIDESPRIELLADHLDLPGVQLEILGRGVFALSLEYLRQWDIPLTGPGFMLEYPLVARAAADGVTTLLDGQGGNEIFDFSPYLAADRLRRGRIVSSWRLVRDFPLGLDSASWKQSFGLWRRFALKGAVPYRLQRAVRLHRGPARYVPDYLSTESAQSFFEGEDPLAWKRNAQAPLWWAWKAYITTRIWEEARLPEYLRHRAAMGGIEARPPLMDTRLIELALSVPPELNFDSLHDRPIMREGLRARVPDTVRLWREKSNLAPLYYAAVLEDIPGVRRILVSRGAEVRAFVRPDAVEALLEKPPPPGGRGYLDWMASIWSLVVVECWLRQQGDPGFAERTLESGLFRTPSSRTIRDRS